MVCFEEGWTGQTGVILILANFGRTRTCVLVCDSVKLLRYKTFFNVDVSCSILKLSSGFYCITDDIFIPSYMCGHVTMKYTRAFCILFI